jgi:hypothetical protein
VGVTGSIAVNIVLAVAVVLSLLWLLGHHGIRRGRHHDLRAIGRMRMRERMSARRGISSRNA